MTQPKLVEVAASDATRDTGEADLVGYGRLPWAEFRALIGESSAAWADYDGFHIRPAPPDDAPPYSHLWAWSDQWLIRARIEGAHAITGALVLTAEPPAAPPAKVRERVTYQRARSETWPPGEKRVGQLTPDVAGRPVTLYLIAGAQPVTFIAVDPQP